MTIRARSKAAAAGLLSLLIALPAVLWAAAPSPSLVGVLESQRQRAMVAADTTALDTLLADDMTYTHSTGTVQSKRELMEMLASGAVRYLSFETGSSTVHDYGTTFVVTGTQTLNLSVRGKRFEVVTRFTVVWLKQSGHWRCVAYQSTPVPEEGRG